VQCKTCQVNINEICGTVTHSVLDSIPRFFPLHIPQPLPVPFPYHLRTIGFVALVLFHSHFIIIFARPKDEEDADEDGVDVEAQQQAAGT